MAHNRLCPRCGLVVEAGEGVSVNDVWVHERCSDLGAPEAPPAPSERVDRRAPRSWPTGSDDPAASAPRDEL